MVKCYSRFGMFGDDEILQDRCQWQHSAWHDVLVKYLANGIAADRIPSRLVSILDHLFQFLWFIGHFTGQSVHLPFAITVAWVVGRVLQCCPFGLLELGESSVHVADNLRTVRKVEINQPLCSNEVVKTGRDCYVAKCVRVERLDDIVRHLPDQSNIERVEAVRMIGSSSICFACVLRYTQPQPFTHIQAPTLAVTIALDVAGATGSAAATS